MKKIFLVLALGIAAVAFTGCGDSKKKNEGVDLRNGGFFRGDNTQNNANCAPNGDPMADGCGKLLTGLSDQAVRDFVSSFIPAQNIGSVTCPNCGVAIWLKITPQNGMNYAALQGPQPIAGSATNVLSHLRIRIVDDKVGQTDSSGKPFGAIQVDIPRPGDSSSNAQGTVAPNGLQATFTDSFGTIAVSGNINSHSIFITSITFQNSKNVSGGSPASGTLGGAAQGFGIGPSMLP